MIKALAATESALPPRRAGRVADDGQGHRRVMRTLTGSGSHNAQVMAKVSRDVAGWSMTAIGAPANGRTSHYLLPAISSSL